jgi:hypothetical protein
MRSWRAVGVGVCLLVIAGCCSWRCHPWFNGCGPISRLTGRCRIIPGNVVMPEQMPAGTVIDGGMPMPGPTVIESEHGPIFSAPPGTEFVPAPQAPNFEAPPSKELAPAPRSGASNNPSLSRPVPTRTTGQAR